MIKKVLLYLFGTVLIIFVAFWPAQAKAVLTAIGYSLLSIATGFGDFFDNVVA